MGYNTQYTLEWVDLGNYPDRPNCDHDIPKGAKFCPTCGIQVGVVGLADQISNAIEEDENIAYALCGDGCTNQSCKWYAHETEMRAFSKRFKDVLFTLRGEGEEAGDIWVKYFLNGRMQAEKAQIVVAPFDKSKLA